MSTPHSSFFDTTPNRVSTNSKNATNPSNNVNSSLKPMAKPNSTKTDVLQSRAFSSFSLAVLSARAASPSASTSASPSLTKLHAKNPSETPNKWYDMSRKLVKAGQQLVTNQAINLRHDTLKTRIAEREAAKAQKVFGDSIKQKHVGIVNIICTHNNTIINLTDNYGNVIINRTPRQLGFKGTKRSTSYAASVAAEQVYNIAVLCKFNHIIIQVKGFGPGRSSALYVLTKRNLSILRVVDLTPIPHNGCRAPKKRRI